MLKNLKSFIKKFNFAIFIKKTIFRINFLILNIDFSYIDSIYSLIQNIVTEFLLNTLTILRAKLISVFNLNTNNIIISFICSILLLVENVLLMFIITNLFNYFLFDLK